MEIKAVVLAGYKNSGKTTLALDLCSYFDSKGLKTGVVKFVHHGLDKEGTDTEKLSKVAHCVLGISNEETSIFWKRKLYLLDIVPMMDVDVILIEGGRDEIDYIPRVLLPKKKSEIGELDNGLGFAVWGEFEVRKEGLIYTRDIKVLGELILEKGFILPNINCGACGRESCFDLAKEIVQGKAKVKECKSLYEKGIKVKINEQPMALNPFVRDIINNTIRGLFSCLKGYSPGSKISIEIEG